MPVLQTILNYNFTNIAVFELMLRATSVSFFYAYEIHGFTPEGVCKEDLLAISYLFRLQL